MISDKYNRRINYLRISVTDRCNLRCMYCMPSAGIRLINHEDILSFEEIHEFTFRAVRMGIEKVRITGGEPLVRKGIVTLVSMLAGVDGIKDFAMTTNGTLLREFAAPLRKAGLHRLNISLDSMDPDTFRAVTRGGELAQVLDGIAAAKEAGFSKIKLNCVVRKSSDEKDAQDVAEFARRQGLEVRFIPRMDMSKGEFSVVDGGDGGNCAICNRLRLSSDGKIYPCLFNDICFPIRELGIERALELALQMKPESGQKSLNNQFYAIGG